MSDNICKRGKKFRIYPTEEQKDLIDKFINIYRYIYNWGISKLKESYELKKMNIIKRNYSFFDLGRMLSKMRSQPGNEWLKELPFNTSKLALREVCYNYKRFFNKHSKHSPHFKSKNEFTHFKTRHNRFYIDNDKIRFEGLKRFSTGPGAKVETIDLGFNTKFRKEDNIKYYDVCIFKDNLNNYWISYVIDEPKIQLSYSKSEPLGIDVGIRNTFTLSTGETFIRPNDKLKKLYKRLRHKQKHVSRDNKRRSKISEMNNVSFDQIPASKRSIKRSNEVKKLFKHITNIKLNFYHNIIKEIILRNPQIICIENIKVRSLLKDRHVNKEFANKLATSDFYTMRRIFEDKCEKYDINLIEADSYFPSSQICSNCGNIKKIHSCHTYICPNCGLRIDRDLNAAINLRNFALTSF